MKTTLYVTRHGETEWNVEKRMQGRLDSSLTKKGIRQAEELGERMRTMPLDAIYTSVSGRAVHTAEIIGTLCEVSVVQEPLLQEIYMGTWEGMKATEIQRQFPEAYDLFWQQPHLFEPYGGERFAEANERALTCVQHLLQEHEGESILVVTHAVVAKCIVGHFAKVPLANIWNDPFMYGASLSVIEIEDGVATVRLFADTAHFTAM